MATARFIKTAILISGSGSNMEALVKSSLADGHPARVTLVISNKPKAYGLTRAQNLGVMAMAIDHKQFDTREAFEAALDTVLREAGIELICCAGFMRVLTGWFTARWSGRIINIHPSLLPRHKGLHTHARAIEAGDAEHGASVHWVSEELDGGAVIEQARVNISSDDTQESLAAKILKIEHPLYCAALYTVAELLLSNKTH